MDMVFHHLHGINLQIIRGCNLVKEILDRLGHLPDQDRLAVLRGPNDVILQVINGMGTCFVGHTKIVAALRAARFPPHSKLWGTQRDFSWLQELHTYGLLRGAFRPEDEVCVLRSSVRQRSMLVAMASRAVQHMQKALEQMHLKLTEVVSDITGKTGMTILRAILAGERDPQLLATYRDTRCKHDQGTIAKALTGHWRAEHLFALQQAVEQYDFLAQQLRACDGHIEGCLQAFVPDVETDASQSVPARTWRSSRSNPLSFEVQAYLEAMTGVDLTQIDGIDSLTALKVISEIGLDLTRWPTSKHCAAWLGLCPGNKLSGGKRYRMRSKPSANRAATALRLAAQGVANSHSALGAYYRRMRARLGAPKAITATAHKDMVKNNFLDCLSRSILTTE
jgi:transposase